MNKRVVILWVCFFVWAVSLMAQDVPGGVVAALSDKVELILEDRSINVDRRTAEGKMAAFFSGNQVSGFTVNHQGKRDESGFIVGTLTTANGNFRVNCFFRKVADKYVIHQIRIDKTNE